MLLINISGVYFFNASSLHYDILKNLGIIQSTNYWYSLPIRWVATEKKPTKNKFEDNARFELYLFGIIAIKYKDHRLFFVIR